MTCVRDGGTGGEEKQTANKKKQNKKKTDAHIYWDRENSEIKCALRKVTGEKVEKKLYRLDTWYYLQYKSSES